ncbi:hypothetical protein, partial [Pseudomonas sp. MWU12-2323]
VNMPLAFDVNNKFREFIISWSCQFDCCTFSGVSKNFQKLKIEISFVQISIERREEIVSASFTGVMDALMMIK